MNCSLLTCVNLHDTICELESSAFAGCTNLKQVKSLGRINGLESMIFKDCISLTEVVLHDSIETIGSSCFFHCPQLAKIQLPQSINQIGDYAFAYCGLKELNVQWTTPININNNTFTGSNLAQITLYVPENTKAIYKLDPTWGEFGTIIEKEKEYEL